MHKINYIHSKNPGFMFLTQMLGWAFWASKYIYFGLFFQCLGSFCVTQPLGQVEQPNI